jgi:hypothetical protein
MNATYFNLLKRLPVTALETEQEKRDQADVLASVAFDESVKTFATQDNSELLKDWQSVQERLEKLNVMVVSDGGTPALQLKKPANYVSIDVTAVKTAKASGGKSHAWDMTTNSDGTLVSCSVDGEEWYKDVPAGEYIAKTRAECKAREINWYQSEAERRYTAALAKAKGA